MLYKLLIKIFGLKDTVESEIKKEIFIKPEYKWIYNTEKVNDAK
jgi:hypothetical protein